MLLRPYSLCVTILLAIPTIGFAQDKQQPDERQMLEKKLDRKMEFEYRRTPFQDVVADISTRSEIPISLDGQSLKAEGLTQNISQSFVLKDATVREALLGLLKGIGSRIIASNSETLIVLYDDKTHGLIVSTRRHAEDKKLKPYRLKSLTLEDKLQQKIDINFRKTAMKDAFAYISDQSEIPIVLDGESLKSAGFTQNMNLEMNLGIVTVQEAILAILKGKGHKIINDNPDTMVLIYDEKSKGFTVSTVPYATDKGFKPYPFKQD